MNNWHLEVMAEERRKELREQAEHLELERIATSKPASRRWLGKSMLGLADWMIATGRELRGRYGTSADIQKDLGSTWAR